MKDACSNRTDNLLQRVIRWSAVCFMISALASCVLVETKPTPPTEPAPESDTTKSDLPCSTLSARELERQSLELLDAGDTLAAREKLDCALELSPGSSQASLLVEQLDANPSAYLGSEYFEYTVKSNETLSKIAQQFLGSSLKFVILARYNDIDVPANLVAGQDIKIPGTAPVTVAAPEPVAPQEPTAADAGQLRDQAMAMEQQGDLEQAFEFINRALEIDPDLENAQADQSRIKQGLILQLEEDAYNQELSGYPQEAAEIWRRILSINPGNIPAQLALKRLTESE